MKARMIYDLDVAASTSPWRRVRFAMSAKARPVCLGLYGPWAVHRSDFFYLSNEPPPRSELTRRSSVQLDQWVRLSCSSHVMSALRKRPICLSVLNAFVASFDVSTLDGVLIFLFALIMPLRG
ncbi:hypothetical protein B0H12DRAFT_50065 [Mycena haematopus]|nr:hypothetical protein B0H12DRAFT_50065 [Mycena haematopus]